MIVPRRVERDTSIDSANDVSVVPELEGLHQYSDEEIINRYNCDEHRIDEQRVDRTLGEQAMTALNSRLSTPYSNNKRRIYNGKPVVMLGFRSTKRLF